jgi:PAS domain S-box-containing protein
MHWQYTPYFLPLTALAAVAIVLAILAYYRRPASGAKPLALLMLAVTAWSLGYALEMASADLPAKILWAKVQYLGIVAAPVLWLVFVLEHADRRKWLTRRNMALLAIVPLVTLLLVYTNDLHGLIWRETKLDVSLSFSVLELTHGLWFWVFIGYAYLMLVLGTATLVRMVVRSLHLYRWQAGVAMIGALGPWVGNALYILDLSPFPHLDLTPFGFILTGVAAVWGLLRFRLLDIVPVARDAVIEEMRDSVVVLDVQNRVVDLNPAARRIVDKPVAEVIGHPIDQVLPSWCNALPCQLDAIPEQDELILFEGEEQRYYEPHISALSDRRGELTGRLVVLYDITERKKAEQERERLIEALDAYAHTVAHDLKNPLAAVGGFADVLGAHYEAMTAQQRREVVQSIQQSSHRMSNIIDELLLLASVRKKEDIQTVPLDMETVVENVLGRLAYMVDEWQAEIVLPGKWPVAMGYGSWVEEVWANYISNAIKYGGRPPRVELCATTRSDGVIHFWVLDNGPGLTPEEQVRLFTPFTRLDQASAKGHGLGLSIVRRIVERLGGQAGVESEVGQGSRFYFTLPAAETLGAVE